MKEGDSPITATDFYVYIRDKYFSVYVHGRKDERKGGRQEIIPVNYLVKISVGMLEIDFSAYVEGRR